jgi:hypothetical protein
LPDQPARIPASASSLQPIGNPNDERVKVFKELESKADADDTEALERLAEYYYFGTFPAMKSHEKAQELWVKGASLGSANCAAVMSIRAFPRESTDSEVVIERTKWSIISFALRMKRDGFGHQYPSRSRDISEPSFEEAKARAAAFLTGVKVSTTAPATSSRKGTGMGSASGAAVGVGKLRVPALKFESLSLFDTHRKNVCSAYIKAASPIYNKGEAATADEKAAFTVAAAELVRLQSYIGKVRRLSLSSKNNATSRVADSATMSECYAKMSAAKIATSLPATRAELNEASIYINGLGNIMQLPVSLGGEY